MEEVKQYLLDIGFDDAHLPDLFNDDDKSTYTIPELMQAYADHKLKLLGIPIVSVSFKTLLEKADSLYEQAKQAPSEREELILASKSIMCRNLANEALNER